MRPHNEKKNSLSSAVSVSMSSAVPSSLVEKSFLSVVVNGIFASLEFLFHYIYW